jgi:hypothetical protein
MTDDQEARSLAVAEYVRQMKEAAGQSIQQRGDESDDPEAWQLLAMIQGMMAGMAMRPDGLSSVVQVKTIETPQDDFGNYLDHFVVVTRSDRRIRVTFSVE